MPDGPDQSLPLNDYNARGTPSPRDIGRATAVSLAMVALLYAAMGVLYMMYISRGVPLPSEGTWKFYTFGVAAVLGLCAVVAFRVPIVASVAALLFFFLVNGISIIQDPGSVAHGAIVKVLAFIILLRATVQSFESRGLSRR